MASTPKVKVSLGAPVVGYAMLKEKYKHGTEATCMHNGRTPQETLSLSTATWAKNTVRELGGCASKYGPAGLIICHVHSNGQHNNALHKSTSSSRRSLTMATPTSMDLSC